MILAQTLTQTDAGGKILCFLDEKKQPSEPNHQGKVLATISLAVEPQRVTMT